jgi:hypothetical protein
MDAQDHLRLGRKNISKAWANWALAFGIFSLLVPVLLFLMPYLLINVLDLKSLVGRPALSLIANGNLMNLLVGILAASLGIFSGDSWKRGWVGFGLGIAGIVVSFILFVGFALIGAYGARISG